jgi:TPR repeat protein
MPLSERKEKIKLVMSKVVERAAVKIRPCLDALDLFQSAARAGDVRAQLTLGMLYHTGQAGLVEQSMRKAAPWYAMAAAKGDATAQGVYGLFLKEGHGGGALYKSNEIDPLTHSLKGVWFQPLSLTWFQSLLSNSS